MVLIEGFFVLVFELFFCGRDASVVMPTGAFFSSDSESFRPVKHGKMTTTLMQR